MKVLLTNAAITIACIASTHSSNVARARFTVDEVVKLTIDFYRRNYIEGLFLSSASSAAPIHHGAGGECRA